LTAPRLLHERIRGVRAEEGRGEVRVEHAAPLGQRVLVDRLADVRAGVVDEDVEAPEALARRAHEPRDRGLVGHVDAHRARGCGPFPPGMTGAPARARSTQTPTADGGYLK